MLNELRLCLDLNIWVAALLADKRGKQNTASQCLVRIVKQGIWDDYPVQLVISWGMLERLSSVLIERLNVSRLVTESYIQAIQEYAELGSLRGTQLPLGGTGVIALRDVEDRHVLETALAGYASALVTMNLKDFSSSNTRIIDPERHLIYNAPHYSFHIINPFLMMDWIRSGKIPKTSDWV
jgi:predicted nucleic acid-binding protein